LGQGRGDQLISERHQLLFDVEKFDAIDSKKFKLDPAGLVNSLRWQRRAEPPDFKLVLLQAAPQHWVNTANLALLAEPRRGARHAID
jgi:hypothetical protein